MLLMMAKKESAMMNVKCVMDALQLAPNCFRHPHVDIGTSSTALSEKIGLLV